MTRVTTFLATMLAVLVCAAAAEAQETLALRPEAGVYQVTLEVPAVEPGFQTPQSAGVVVDDGRIAVCAQAAPGDVVDLPFQVDAVDVGKTATARTWAGVDCSGDRSPPAVRKTTGEEVTLTFELLPPQAPFLTF